MTNGRDDKAGVGQRLCSVMMETEPAALTVGEHHQRELHASDRTIPHAFKGIGKGHSEAAKRHILRLSCTWIPNSARERWSFEQLDASAPRGICQTTKCQGTSKIVLEYQSRPQNSANGTDRPTEARIVSSFARAETKANV
jgi:hypothetical protein